MSFRKARHCANHPESHAQFYCRNCKQFLCEACVEEKFSDDDYYEACGNCGMRCIEEKWVRPPNIETHKKGNEQSVSSSFLKLILHPMETIDSAVENSSFSFILTRLLPIFVGSLFLDISPSYMSFSASFFARVFQPTFLLISYAVVLITICRIYGKLVSTVLSSTDEDKITGWDDIVKIVLALIYFLTVNNISRFLLRFLPPSLFQQVLGHGIGIGCDCLLAFFIREIYDLKFLYAFVLVFVTGSVSFGLYVNILVFINK